MTEVASISWCQGLAAMTLVECWQFRKVTTSRAVQFFTLAGSFTAIVGNLIADRGVAPVGVV